ncbi:MAG: hypothetical protein Pg6C_02960 [Treponemataceae bacterium]|nr:MAG: hypothetical protein Pg6C_02960 [Treponemataceae bacterium]
MIAWRTLSIINRKSAEAHKVCSPLNALVRLAVNFVLISDSLGSAGCTGGRKKLAVPCLPWAQPASGSSVLAQPTSKGMRVLFDKI